MSELGTLLKDKKLPGILHRILMMNRRRKPALVRYNRISLKQRVINRRWNKPRTKPWFYYDE